MNFRYVLSLAIFILTISSTYERELKHSTLCRLTNGTEGSCPVRDASCCESGDFCCPKGFECDLSNHRCVKDSVYMPFHLRLSDIKVSTKRDILCPDNITTCKETQTCCLFDGDDYGCCPILKAVCCSDHVHCCPDGYTCNPSQGKCDKNKDVSGLVESIDWKKKQPGVKKIKQSCPGGDSECPQGTTCCQLSSGEYGCCPLENAVCCSDHLHCCPTGYSCDVADGRCNKGDVSLPFYKKIQAKKTKKEKVSIECPGGGTECPSGTTCCELDSGDYGCCPLENAVCCNDHVHCCPNGYTCDVADGRCNKGDVSLPFYQKISAIKTNKKSNSVVCPGGGAECPQGTTCCQLDDGSYGCCPLENAVCCSDHIHCCPTGYTCDVKDGRCNKGDVSLPFYKKIQARKVEETVVCPGGGAECPQGTTCCQLDSGEYGCCPLSNAVCCNDHIHCCPSGYTCDVEDGRCNKGYISLPFYKKIDAKLTKKVENFIEKPAINYQKSELNSVVCPDGSSFCPKESTCCKMADGTYGCCPLPSAICCADNLHCCPQNTRCNLDRQACETGINDNFINWFEKGKPKKYHFNENEKEHKLAADPVVCPDNSTCDPLKTCCLLSTAGTSYGCCPYSDGVCCPEINYCCPGGSKCGSQFGECLSINTMKVFQLNWHTVEDKAKLFEKEPVKSDVCGVTETKCLTSTGNFSCCPYSNGTCCGPEGYCCPKMYTCDPKLEACVYNDPDAKLESKKLLNAKKTNQKYMSLFTNDKAIKCKNSDYLCSDSYTCCSSPTDDDESSYGCCPIQNAVCCDNGIDCCPTGYSCTNNADGGCVKDK